MILQLAPDYFNTSIYSLLFDALKALDVDSHVFVSDNKPHPELTSSDRLTVVPKSFNTIQRVLYFPKQRYLFNHIINNIDIQKVDIVHAHTLFSSGYLAYRLKKKYGIPYIVAVRNTDVNVFMHNMPHLLPLGRKIAGEAQKIIFLSDAYKHQVIGHYFSSDLDHKSVVIPNGISSVFLNGNATPHSLPNNRLNLIFVGRVEKAKNIDTCIAVADRLHHDNTNVTLTLVGEMKDNRFLTEIQKRNYVKWINKSTQKDIITYLNDNDIFIMPSFKETFGLAYAEAMSQGLPVIYTRGQGFDGQYADGEVGYAVEPDNIEEITKCIHKIVNDYRNISARCIDHSKKYDWNIISMQYKQIYDSILTVNA